MAIASFISLAIMILGSCAAPKTYVAFADWDRTNSKTGMTTVTATSISSSSSSSSFQTQNIAEAYPCMKQLGLKIAINFIAEHVDVNLYDIGTRLKL